MALLTRDQILALPLRHEDVDVPGGTIRVWELSAAQLLEVQELAGAAEDKRRTGFAYAARCVGGESGPFSPPFTVDELVARSGLAMTRLVQTAMRLNFASAEAQEEARGN